jgi:excisionase family DNA binding protein
MAQIEAGSENRPGLCDEAYCRDYLGGIGRTKWYELIGSGELPSVRLGRRRLVRHAELDRFIERLAAGAQ